MSYDDQNIFAKILRGEIPNVTVYEDAETLCFMDIMPRADGHCLVIPKTPCRNMLDASAEQLAACMKTVNKVPRHEGVATRPPGKMGDMDAIKSHAEAIKAAL